jgi:hypothetical protein
MAQLLGRLPQLAAVLGDANVQAYLAAGPGDTIARQQVVCCAVYKSSVSIWP